MEKSRKKLPAGWEMKTLGEIAEIKGGKRIPKGCSLEIKPTNYPYIRVSDFNDNGSVDIKDIHYITKEIHSLIKNYTISTNDLYISIAGTIGKTGIIPKVLDGANLTENACKLVLKKDIDNKFVYYFTKSDEFITQAGFNTRVTAMPKLALNRLSTIKILIPPLSEQQRIVAKLDDAFAEIEAAKANIERNLQNCKEVFQCALTNELYPKKDWLKMKLKDVCSKITDGTHQTPKYFDEGFIFLSSRNVTSGIIDWKNIKYIDEKQHIEMQKRVSPQIGDILLAKNGTTGVAAIVDKDIPFDIYVSLALLRPLNIVNPLYFLHFVNSPIAKEQFNKRLKGIGVPNLHLEEIREVLIAFPKSLSEQHKIVTRLNELKEQTEQAEQFYQQKLSSLEELKKSILQKAFSGEF